MTRKIKKIENGRTKYDGAGVKLTKLLWHPNVYDFDPFLMLDSFDLLNPVDYVRGFPWHPHRGMETITYLMSGKIEHCDSLGNIDTIVGGECQRMTAGCGVMHNEMPLPSKRMRGVQLWINVPASKKMTRPRYEKTRADAIPQVEELGAVVRVISGSYQGTDAALCEGLAGVSMLDVTLEENAWWSFPSAPDETVFAYTIEGLASFDNEAGEIPKKRCVLFENGGEIVIRAGARGARFLMLAGRPLHEPIAWGESIVMNTEEELQQAFQELHEGSFIWK